MSPFVDFLSKWLYLSSLLSYNRKELLSIPQPQLQLGPPVTPKLYFSSTQMCDWQRSVLFSIACHASAEERFLAVDETRSWTYRELLYNLHATHHHPKKAAATNEERMQLLEFYEHLPQLVSVALHSPHCAIALPSYSMGTNQHPDPIFELRKLLLRQCRDDPNMGIALCWQLEAELGRAWKTLFEHMEQTGRSLRFVFIGSAALDEALLLAKVGKEKKAAFYLLRDARLATAFGYVEDDDDPQTKLSATSSDLRCSHFWDAMQFVDQITQISLDLRRVPVVYRERVLQEGLGEMNRRVRRRMITRGSVNLDVEDGCCLFDRPHLSDLTLDMFRYSIHFPMQPMRGKWPSGESSTDVASGLESERGGVVRVLNIIEPECRLLASRERCPFLVRMEVVETGLEGSDPRLYEQSNNDSDLQHPREYTRMPKLYQQSDNDSDLQQPKEGTRIPHLQVSGGMQNEGDYLNYEHKIFHSYHYEQSYMQHDIKELAEQLMNKAVVDEISQSHELLPMGTTLLDKIYGTKWSTRCEIIRQSSPFGRIKGWKLASFIMKAGEDIRREALVMQCISKLEKYFENHLSPWERPYLRPYTVMCVGGDSGLLECVPDCKNVDEVKKQCIGFTTLRDYFERAYGPPKRIPFVGSSQVVHGPTAHESAIQAHTPPPPPHAAEVFDSEVSFEQAQDNFLRSLVGYSLVCYILQIKDRHNANILLCRDGHLLHIDFGFLLGEAPKMGKVPIFSERAPFKLTSEFWEVLGGWNVQEGGLGVRFCKMLENAFACASDYSDELSTLIEAAVLNSSCSPSEARAIAEEVRSRLRMRGPRGSKVQQQFIKDLVHTALNSWETSSYDLLQQSMNGYQA